MALYRLLRGSQCPVRFRVLHRRARLVLLRARAAGLWLRLDILKLPPRDLSPGDRALCARSSLLRFAFLSSGFPRPISCGRGLLACPAKLVTARLPAVVVTGHATRLDRHERCLRAAGRRVHRAGCSAHDICGRVARAAVCACLTMNAESRTPNVEQECRFALCSAATADEEAQGRGADRHPWPEPLRHRPGP